MEVEVQSASRTVDRLCLHPCDAEVVPRRLVMFNAAQRSDQCLTSVNLWTQTASVEPHETTVGKAGRRVRAANASAKPRHAMPRQSLAGRASGAREGFSARRYRMSNSRQRPQGLKPCVGTIAGDVSVWQWMSRAARTQAFGCAVMVGVAAAWAGSAIFVGRGESTPQGEATLQLPRATPKSPPFERKSGSPAIGTADREPPMNPAPPVRSPDGFASMNGPDVESRVTPNVDMWSRAPALSLDAALAELDQDQRLADAWAAQHLPGPAACSAMCVGQISLPPLPIESPPMPVAPPMAQAPIPAPNEGDMVPIPPPSTDIDGVPHGQQPGLAPGLAG